MRIVMLHHDLGKDRTEGLSRPSPGPSAYFYYHGTYEHEEEKPMLRRHFDCAFRGPKRIQRVGTILPHLYRCAGVHDGEHKEAWFASNEVHKAWKDVPGLVWEETIISKMVDYRDFNRIDYTGFDGYEDIDELPDMRKWLEQFPHCPECLPAGFGYYEYFFPMIGRDILPKLDFWQEDEDLVDMRMQLKPEALAELESELFKKHPIMWMGGSLTMDALLLREDCFKPIAPLLDDWYYSWKTYTIPDIRLIRRDAQ